LPPAAGPDLCVTEADPTGRCALLPGDFRPSRFRPSISFALPAGWSNLRYFPDAIALLSERTALSVVSGELESESEGGDRAVAASTASEMMAFLQADERLRTLVPGPASVAGQVGMSIDLVSVEDIEPLFLTDQDSFDLDLGDRARFLALDVEGMLVVLIIESAPGLELADSIAQIEPILDSVQWGSSPG